MMQRTMNEIIREMHWIEAQLASGAKGKPALRKYHRALYQEFIKLRTEGN